MGALPPETHRPLRHVIAAVLLWVAGGCASAPKAPAARPDVAPATQPSASLSLRDAQVRPMYTQLLAVDLPTVSRVAMARATDVREAQQRVRAAEGRYESSVEVLFPVIAPTFAYQHLEGVNQNASGTLISTN